MLNLLQNKLKALSKKKVHIKVKEYKSTYISVYKDRYNIKISLHSLFLSAPQEIIDAIVNYSVKKDVLAFKEIKKYAANYFSKIDYSHKLDKKKLVSKGKYYDLQQIYNNLNDIYFEGKLNLNITWFTTKYRNFSHFTFGSYDKSVKLIKINYLLDSDKVPFYFINYVVYHEILHHIFPETIDENARRCHHGPDFKKKEKQFPYYKEAVYWEKKHFKIRKLYGRT